MSSNEIGCFPRPIPTHSRFELGRDNAKHQLLYDLRGINHLPWVLGNSHMGHYEQANLCFKVLFGEKSCPMPFLQMIMFLGLFSRSQMRGLQSLLQGDKANPKSPLSGNVRPVQPMNGRTVRTNINFPSPPGTVKDSQKDAGIYGVYGSSYEDTCPDVFR